MSSITRLTLVLALALAASAGCDRDSDFFPGGDPGHDLPNGGTAPGEDLPDAASDGSLDGAPAGRIKGRLCVLGRLDAPNLACTLLDDAAIQVAVEGSGVAVEVTNGRFDLPSPGGSSPTRLIATEIEHPIYFGAALEVRVDDAGNAQGVDLWVASRDTIDTALALAATQRLPGNGIVLLRFPGTTIGSYFQNVILDRPNDVTPYYDTVEGGFAVDGGTGPAGTAIYFDMPPGKFTAKATKQQQVDTFSSRSVDDALLIQRQVFTPDP